MTLKIIIIIILCGFLSYCINWFLLKFASNRLAKDAPQNSKRWEEKKKPTIGGISFMTIFLLTVILYFILFNDKSENRLELSILILSTGLGFALGLLDDLKNAPIWAKFSSQFLIAILFLCFGYQIHIFNNIIIDSLLTILWVIGIMNSINMLDNMDGVTASTTLVIFIGLIVFLFLNLTLTSLNHTDSDFLNLIILIGIATSLIVFLYFNHYPSKMYMGDVGSQFLGVLLAAFAIKYLWNGIDIHGDLVFTKQVAALISAFIIPLTDTTTVFYKRIKRKNSPFQGGKDHTTHHLVYAGMSQKLVAPLYAFLTLIGMSICYVIFYVEFTWNLWWFFGIIIYNFSIFTTLFYIANQHLEKDK